MDGDVDGSANDVEPRIAISSNSTSTSRDVLGQIRVEGRVDEEYQLRLTAMFQVDVSLGHRNNHITVDIHPDSYRKAFCPPSFSLASEIRRYKPTTEVQGIGGRPRSFPLRRICHHTFAVACAVPASLQPYCIR